MTKPDTRKMCRYCLDKPARKGSYFCSNWCGCAMAEDASVDHAWCSQCGAWVWTGPGGYCEHYTGDVTTCYSWPADLRRSPNQQPETAGQ